MSYGSKVQWVHKCAKAGFRTIDYDKELVVYPVSEETARIRRQPYHSLITGELITDPRRE